MARAACFGRAGVFARRGGGASVSALLRIGASLKGTRDAIQRASDLIEHAGDLFEPIDNGGGAVRVAVAALHAHAEREMRAAGSDAYFPRGHQVPVRRCGTADAR